ncbi:MULTISPECIES: DUF2818 family protein [unclassified Roseateles]|uniref:DUF2818 family protein n=1 Tax=unclassified Roseateles TaxID=2626991 RepID=UPI0006F69B5C|nr:MULTISPECIES: DUF2818 family protein [unclassified Roseateles]KQW43681.1 hypothetical protein ASC81_18195 [Pelomonas sp. Root405]KRA71419.1 hypothetical protein ASD88_16715 [Pelomonas sp. Root662]
MDQSAAVWLVLIAAVIAANLPYFSERLLLVGPRRTPKTGWWRLLELLLMAMLVFGLGSLLEARIGQRHSQGWEFYAAASCLFVTLGFPGFVWRYLRRGAHRGED